MKKDTKTRTRTLHKKQGPCSATPADLEQQMRTERFCVIWEAATKLQDSLDKFMKVLDSEDYSRQDQALESVSEYEFVVGEFKGRFSVPRLLTAIKARRIQLPEAATGIVNGG